jgi:CubicO group peptidase (beta-lactamase class C family)
MTRFILASTITLALTMQLAAGQPTAAQPEAAAPAAASAAAAPEDISAMLAPILKKHDLPAMAIMVLDGNTVIARGVSGVRKRGSPDLATLDDKWHIGSCGKAITATVMATLVDDGTLAWHTSPAMVFRDDVEKIHAAWGKVTLEQLLSNRAGAPADLDADDLWTNLCKQQGSQLQQRLQLVRGVITRPPTGYPGHQFVYSNAGFAIAGAMGEKLTGKAWEDLAGERVFRPLGMASAGFGAPGTAVKGDGDAIDQPRGHLLAGLAVEPGTDADNPPAIAPAGTMHMTLDDWGRFVGFHLTGRARDDALGLALSADSLRTLHTSMGTMDAKSEDGYAMGWIVTQRPWAKPKKAAKGQDDDALPAERLDEALTHAGSNTMWFCVAWLAPQKQMAVLVVCNQGGPKATKATDEAAGLAIRRFIANR